jgi:RimJ/RimL family protein N-acetyltransferase
VLDFSEDIILENEVVRLQPLKLEDCEALNVFSINEPNLWQYSLVPANSPTKMKAYVEAAIKDRVKETAYPFLVIDKRNQKIAGSTRFYDIQPYHNTTQVGYTWLGQDFQGTGLNQHCKYLILSYAFDKLRLDRVEFRADANNNRSIAAMKSLGCTVEGILRRNCKSETGRRDSIILSILKEEWYASLKHIIKTKLFF